MGLKLIFLGPPGAGKGTQAVRVSQKLHLPHISTGDIFRQHLKAKTELGKLAQGYMDKGLLVPDEVVISIVRERIAEPDCGQGFILDGFPRTTAQAQALDGIINIDRVINVDVPDDTIIKRLSNRRVCPSCGGTYGRDLIGSDTCPSCGTALVQREDDKPETVRKRLSVYHEQTQPLIEYYSADGRLTDIDGSLGIDNVFNKIMSALGSDAK